MPNRQMKLCRLTGEQNQLVAECYDITLLKGHTNAAQMRALANIRCGSNAPVFGLYFWHAIEPPEPASQSHPIYGFVRR